MAPISPEIDLLISSTPAQLPLIQAALSPAPGTCKIRSQNPEMLFSGARHKEVALAGLLFRLGCWGESHSVAQDIQSAEGSYWHGMLHRIEPDSGNARYWFARVGEHPIFPELFRSAEELLSSGGPKHWRLKARWDPFLFVDWCDEAREAGGLAETTAIEIQMAEWRLLFDWCPGSDSLESTERK